MATFFMVTPLTGDEAFQTAQYTPQPQPNQGNYTTAQAQPVEVQTPFLVSPAFDLALRNSSYVILIVIGILAWRARYSFKSYIAAHIEMMKVLTKTTEQHRESQETTVKALDRITQSNVLLAKILSDRYKIDLPKDD